MLVFALALAAAPAGVARPQVAGLQVALRAHGLYPGPVDGIYGPATARGLRAFQLRAGLAVDGRVGPATRAAFGKLGRPAFGARVLRRHACGWDVSVLQFLLRRNGAVLRVDGCFGAHTQRAVRRFQRGRRLAVDGIAGRQTFRALLRGGPRFVAVAAHTGTGQVRGLIDYWAAHYGVDAALMRALGWMESGYQPDLQSSAGAWGVMQILPSTWSYVERILLGRSVSRTVSGNVRVGTALMRELLREFKGNTRLALAAWYQGPASVRRLGPFQVTRLFVADVLALRQRLA